MRAQRVREAENRVEMQAAKWTSEGAAKSWIYFQPSTLRRRAYVSCRRYAGISQKRMESLHESRWHRRPSEITTDIGAMVNLIKKKSDIPCAVCGRIREINENDSVKKPSVKKNLSFFLRRFFFLASEALFCRKCFRLVVTHPILPDGYKLASRLSITFRTETLFSTSASDSV